MKVLTVDQGNTLMKMTLFDAGREVRSVAVSTGKPEEALPVVDSWAPDGGIFCSVGRFDIRFVETLRQLAGDRLLVLTPHTSLPIGVNYSNPSTLGVDRLAAAAGAFAEYQGEGCVIADCGSALTVDLLDREGVFRGGRISPGVGMRIRALHDFTARLPLIDPHGEVPVAGDSTETSLRAGVVRGTAAEIAQAALDYARLDRIRHLVLTGGDAGLLLPFVMEYIEGEKYGIKVSESRNLLSHGLLRIFDHNLKNSMF